MLWDERCVYVMRHALAETGSVDFERPLSRQGKEMVRYQVNHFQKTDGIRPDCLLCSTAKRAKQTAEILSEFFMGAPVFYQESLYLAPENRIMEILKGTDNIFKRILIIGHNPGLERFVSRLDCMHQTQTLNPADCIAIRTAVSDWMGLKTGVGQIQKIFRARI